VLAPVDRRVSRPPATVVHGSFHSPIVAPGSTIVSKPSRVCASHCRRAHHDDPCDRAGTDGDRPMGWLFRGSLRSRRWPQTSRSTLAR
jgi:hypothetical protein